jgi:DNA protecting protein DprA
VEENREDQPYRQKDLFSRKENSSPDREASLQADRDAAIILGLSTEEGVGFKSIKEFYEASGIVHFLEWDATRLAKSLGECLHQPSSEQVKRLVKSRQELEERGRDLLKGLNDRGINLITENHHAFPYRLSKRMEDAPRWLFVKGSLEALQNPSMVGLVGTREPSKYGKWLAERCSVELAKKNFVVLSGLAEGIDSASHLGAVKAYGQTVAVLGHGIEERLLSEEQKSLAEDMLKLDGTIVSEYLPTDPPSREGYLRRNEVVSALSGLIIPVECPSLQSGTGSTIRRAKSIGTPIAGIKPENGKRPSKALLKTEKNLDSIDVPVLSVFSKNREFWRYLRDIFETHNWSESNKRYERFYKYIKKEFEEANKYFNFDERNIDKLANLIKENIITGKDD